ncbi:copper resistance system multicopper oxidase [Sphingomonas sp.]|uniref:copper resistance system multicopper oxidase n=1 Tax=Sphingomonas sp. TaxID=28214 RepID=UPI000DB167D8|nr:copper resistance system multicopper oxidase [Sphingomonas sp.]PZU07997.1 MAG: copper resistance system multicopper oxidase [Sphingomonas sp.]
MIRTRMARGAAELGRRHVLKAGGAALLAPFWPAWAAPVSPGLAPSSPALEGTDIELRVAHRMLRIDGRDMHAIGLNDMVPGPLLRLREGQDVRLTVINDLPDEDTSIHWHGLLVPFQMDGVPGVSFPGIRPGTRFSYSFPVRQAGTYWYHSHSGLQEQIGHYGPIIIDPAAADPIGHDREHVILLSDHSPLHPHKIFTRLKQQGGYFNYQKQTLAGQWAGRDQKGRDRFAWGGMRMDPADISDVTGSTYTYLVNGHGPADNWTALFRPGERVRLRFINAAAMTIFNVRIPGLTLTVVAADGIPVRPVAVEEFQIANAETYDVIVTPADDRAYGLVAEAIDRSGMAFATLAPRPGLAAAAPPLRRRPLATMRDMGMDMSAMGDDMKGMSHTDMTDMPMPDAPMPEMHMGMRDRRNAPALPLGPGVQTIAPMPADRTGEPGQGLADVGHKVLIYADLAALERNPDVRAPGRAMRIHLTGNMERYMWAFDGLKLNEVKEPIAFTAGERVRITLVNDTMMNHPIHLHGHFFELVTGKGDHAARKHTVNVQPGGTVTFDLTADAVGDWAFHCHMLYHMHAGMMQVVTVRPGAAA